MATILLIVIYIAFIGLGIPDSLFGAAWPAMYAELDLPVSYASIITVLISCGTTLSSLSSARLIARFGTARITAVSTTLTAVALLGFAQSGNMFWLCLCAVPLGVGAGAIDAALNNYVALHYGTAQMNFLHCFYGVGITLSPLLMSFALSGRSWRTGYLGVFWIQAAIAVLTIVSIPLWRRAHPPARSGSQEQARPANPLSLLRRRQVRRGCMVFFGSCGVEGVCNNWGSTFLVSARGMQPDQAALTMTVYFAGLTVGRFLSGVLSSRLTSRQLMRAGQWITLAAILLLMLPLPAGASAGALFLVGMGNGPVFPNMLHLTPRYFGADQSQSVIGVEMALASVGYMASPALFGLAAQHITPALLPVFLLFLFALMLGSSLLLDREARQTVRECAQAG